MKALKLLAVLSVLFCTAFAFSQGKDAEAAKYAKQKATYTSAKAKFAKNPKDAALRKAYVSATVTLGTATMNSPILSSKVKYPQALKYYREALKADPKNKEALENKNLIEGIYKQMGRPIPPSG